MPENENATQPREIRSDSFFYWLWCLTHSIGYFRSKHSSWRDAPEPKNLCQYFWRIVILSVPMLAVTTVIGSVVVAFGAIVVAILYTLWLIQTILRFVLGFGYPDGHPLADLGPGVGPALGYTGTWKPVKIKGQSYPVWSLVMAVEVIAALVASLIIFDDFRHGAAMVSSFTMLWGFRIIASVLAIVLVVYLGVGIKNGLVNTIVSSDAWMTTRDSFKAWKNKHCPVVKVTRPD